MKQESKNKTLHPSQGCGLDTENDADSTGYEPPCIESVSSFDTLLLACFLGPPQGCDQAPPPGST